VRRLREGVEEEEEVERCIAGGESSAGARLSEGSETVSRNVIAASWSLAA
jgi:hypothetical protein